MDKQDFIEIIAGYVQELAPKYGIAVVSPIVAQACLESAYGTSNKARYGNYFGLKYRPGRVTCHSGTFTDSSAEQLKDGSYIGITDQWYKFDTPKDGVEGYFQFINTANYANLKGVTDPRIYLENIKKDGYATSLLYVEHLIKVIDENDLTRFDRKEEQMGILINRDYAQTTYNLSRYSGRKISHVVIHNTATEASAENNCKYFCGGDRGSSADFFIDRDGMIYQFNADPKNYYSWHCGDGAGKYGIRNDNSIGIECVSAGTAFTTPQKDALRNLYAYLRKEYGITEKPVRHYDASRKTCPMAYCGSAAKDQAWNQLVDYIAKEEEKKPEPAKVKAVVRGVHRVYNPGNGEHLYTIFTEEAQNCVDNGWNYEGVAWKHPEEGDPVRRLYSGKEHILTADSGEYRWLLRQGWKDEGICMFSDKEKEVPIYRLYNKNSGLHFYTASADEKNMLAALGWTYECIAFYGVKNE